MHHLASFQTELERQSQTSVHTIIVFKDSFSLHGLFSFGRRYECGPNQAQPSPESELPQHNERMI